MPINKLKFHKGDTVEVISQKRVATYPMGTKFKIATTALHINGNCYYPKNAAGMFEEDLQLIKTKTMSNNLEKAKRALKGEREFEVIIKQEETFKITVQAKNREEAEEAAIEEHNNGCSDSNKDLNTTIESVEETEIEENN